MESTRKAPEAGRSRTFLVRLWQAGPSEPWRASARDVHGSQEQHFASPEALYAFLQRETGEQRGSG